MALVFPLDPSIGSTYQSGSSNTYEWTGTYWKIKNITTRDFVGRTQYEIDSASLLQKIERATNEGQFATTGSNKFIGQQIVSGSILISGSLIPAVGDGTFTSSFTLGSPTNAWKDLYISNGSIIFVDAVTQATSSFSIDNEVGQSTVKYTAAITASKYFGDGGGLYNLPSNTNWNKDKEYILRSTEQLTFSGDYILENAALLIEGGVDNSIGDWTFETWDTNGTYTPTGSNGYIITGPTGDTNASIGIWMHRQFDTNTTMSIDYVWNGTDVGNDWPIYAVDTQYPYEIDTQNRLQDTNSSSESGTWTINVPSGSWLSIGVNTANVNNTVGTLQITLPYLFNEDLVQYSSNKYFKKEGTIFIGGNLLLKDSTIENNGKIYVGGEVILIGDSQITGTGTII